jgi:hypothetical protein
MKKGIYDTPKGSEGIPQRKGNSGDRSNREKYIIKNGKDMTKKSKADKLMNVMDKNKKQQGTHSQ